MLKWIVGIYVTTCWVQNLWFWSRASNGSRLSAFVQISALFQIYITDMSRHLHHLTKCPFEVKKGLKGLFLHWEVIANKQTLPYFVLPSGLRLLCRHWGFCADFCTKKCSLEALFWSLGSKAEAPTCGCFEGTSTSLRVPGDAKMVLEWAIKFKNRVINQGRMFSTDIQPCGSS